MKSCCDEYCANYGCNQGRDCPARVARIGRKDYSREELPPSIWREQIKQLGKWMLIAYMLMFLAMMGYAMLYYAAGLLSMAYDLLR